MGIGVKTEVGDMILIDDEGKMVVMVLVMVTIVMMPTIESGDLGQGGVIGGVVREG